MKRQAPLRLLALALAAALVLGLAASAVSAELRRSVRPTSFSFVALGDSQGPDSSEPVNAPVLAAMVAKVLDLKPRPAFVIFAGDLVVGVRPQDGPRASLLDQLRVWQQLVAPLGAAGIRVYSVPGNHDIHSAAQEAVRRQTLGELQYAFKRQGCCFLALDTERAGYPRGSVDLDWLAAQLARARQSGARHLFVVGHVPAWTSAGEQGLKEAARFWGLLAGAGADAYICGHEHLYGRCSHSGVLQITTGGSGGRLLPLWGAEGFDVLRGENNLTVWRVNGPRVEVEALGWRPDTGQWERIDSLSYTKAAPAARATAAKGRPGKKARVRVAPAALTSPAR